MLLQRATMAVPDAIEHLVGMQAQVPTDPYVGLWTRLDGFDPNELGRMVAEREAVRVSVMRSTIHLLTARDCLRIRALFQPTLERAWATASPFGRAVAGVDLGELLALGREIIEEQPRTTAQIGKLLQARWPDRDANALAYSVRYLLPLIQLPPRGVWGGHGQAKWATSEAWLGRPLDTSQSVDDLVLRYLGAFGPASAADVRTWSWLTGAREILDRLRPTLRTFRDERGRELFDLPDSPRPDPETPAPVRFLPEYDNIGLSHEDRSRIVDDEYRKRLLVLGEIGYGSVLIDGFAAARWHLRRADMSVYLEVEPFQRLASDQEIAASQEGERLLAFLASEAEARDVRILPPVDEP
jgi:hypothetical protein